MTTPRRSERIQQKCNYAPVCVDDSDDISNFSEDLEQSVEPDAEILYTPRRARPKRQKIEHTGIENAQEGRMVRPQRPDKYVRGRRGYLKLMTEMPLDTLHEIFRQLDPLDLLHLSWASKSLHGIIMERSSIYIWEEAYERLYESENPPPQCPEDMNFAQHTRFLYHQKCMVCNTRIGAYTSWMMRLRVCKYCLDSNQFSACEVPDLVGLLTIRAKKTRYVLTRDLEEAKKVMNSNERSKLMNDRMKGTWEFNLWNQSCSRNRTTDQNERRAQRKIAIFKKLEEIGWTESNIKEINYGRLPDDLPGFGTVKKLTNRDWKGIRPKIESILFKMTEDHLALLEKKRLEKRWYQFEEKFQEWDEAQTLDKSFRPRAVDILVVEPFFTAILMTDTEEAEFEVDDIDRAAKEWIEWRDNLVFSVLPQDLQDRCRGIELSLQPLAIFNFFRPLYGTLAVVCGHRKDLRDYVPQSRDEREIYEAVVRLGLYQGPWKWWNQKLMITFDTQRLQVTRDILEYLGMDPYTTTLAQVRECKQTFTCLRCKITGRQTCKDMILHDTMWHHYDEGKERIPVSSRWIRAEEGNVLSCEAS